MSIAAKHAYRFGFLKSDKWQDIRLKVLVNHEGKCYLCGFFSIENDVHHAVYPKDWNDTKPHQCFPLCRKCHNEIHEEVGTEYSFTTFRTAVEAILIRNGTRSYGRRWRVPKKQRHSPNWCCCCRSEKDDTSPVNILERYGANLAWNLCVECRDSMQSNIEWPQARDGVMAIVRDFLDAHRKLLIDTFRSST